MTADPLNEEQEERAQRAFQYVRNAFDRLEHLQEMEMPMDSDLVVAHRQLMMAVNKIEVALQQGSRDPVDGFVTLDDEGEGDAR